MWFERHRMTDLLVTARLCLSCTLLCALWSCDFNKTDPARPQESTQLINEIKSYTTMREFMGAHPQAQVEPGRDGHPGDRWRSKYEVKEVIITNYSHFGQTGKLVVSFFNDRLMSTIFYPNDMHRYLSELKINGIEFKADSVDLSAHTLVRVGTDYQGNKYVDWEDKGLAKEMDEWIKRNA